MLNTDGRGASLTLVRLVVIGALLPGVMAGCKGSGRTKVRPELASLVRPLPPPPPERPVVVPRESGQDEFELGTAQIIPRSDWAQCAPVTSRLEAIGKKTCITVHHDAMDGQGDGAVADVKDQLRRIQLSHMSKGWGDIGYHFLIDSKGRIWEGRPLKYQGAHAGNGEANRNNIGVALMGNFESYRPSAGQVASLRRLLDLLMAKYDISVSRVYTHREVKTMYHLGDTECPGRYLQTEVDRMRKSLAVAKQD